jgi:hypothetical protein
MGVAIRTKEIARADGTAKGPTSAFLLTAKLDGCSQVDDTMSVIGS